jgi:glycosyltransferase involved in cell wall biosynthesis
MGDPVSVSEGTAPKRVMIVQWAGDFRAAWRLRQQAGGETYYGHAYILDQLERLRTSHGEVAIMCCLSPERYQEVLPNGVTVIGAKLHPKREAAAVLKLIADWDPTHLIVLGPLPRLIRWGVMTGRRVLCQFADSFDINPLVRLYRYGRLARLLNDARVEWVSNHGVNACRSLVRLGVDPAKVLPWDWPYQRRPDQTPPRTAIPEGETSLLFVGTLQPNKGIGDTIEAVAALRRRGRAVRLRVAGGGDTDRFRALAEKSGVADLVEFLGVIPNAEVFGWMLRSTAVVVPSRHAYPEGLPLTIYESLCARVPILASDHPMFAGHLVDRETAMVFPASRPAALAAKLEELVGDPALYARLSLNAAAAWERMQNPVKWGDVLFHWLGDGPADRQWLADHRLPS